MCRIQIRYEGTIQIATMCKQGLSCLCTLQNLVVIAQRLPTVDPKACCVVPCDRAISAE
jgi:hypothetical protein